MLQTSTAKGDTRITALGRCLQRPFAAAEAFVRRHGRLVAATVMALSLPVCILQLRILSWYPDMIVLREYHEALRPPPLEHLEHAPPAQLLVAAGTAWLVRDVPTVPSSRVAVFTLLVFADAWLKALGMVVYREPGLTDDAVSGLFDFTILVGSFFKYMSILVWFRLMFVRNASLEKVSDLARVPYMYMMPVIIPVLIFGCLVPVRIIVKVPGPTWLWTTLDVLWILSLLGLLAMILRPFWVVGRIAATAALHSSHCNAPRQSAECLQALFVLRMQATGFVIESLSMVVRFSWFSGMIARITGAQLPQCYWLVIALDDTIAIAAALKLAGAFSGSLSADRRRRRASVRRCKTWLQSSSDWRGGLQNADPAWQSKVEELAERGFTLQALLQFYRKLGTEYMEHWTPSRHTTADVVRHAIVPGSAERRCAMATLMMEGEPTVPEKMVTHNWGNRFRDLVAAVLADALGEAEYSRVAHMLDHDLDELESWLVEAKKISATYWICALSVNQHATICDGNPQGATDTVTQEPYPLCSCGLPKLWNTTAPVTAEGESILCEVNKFDDMMRTLSAANQSFEQVVAIDANFQIFSRAWCVAELSAAHAAGMEQRLKVGSMTGFSFNEESLRQLRIEDMQASRKEDIEAILAKIPDKAAFNAALQRLLFEELLPAWHSIDGEEQLKRLVSITRWHKVAVGRGSAGVWRASTE